MSVSDHLFNAILPALKGAGLWAPLSDRAKIAEAIDAYLDEHGVSLVDGPLLEAFERTASSQVGASREQGGETR